MNPVVPAHPFYEVVFIITWWTAALCIYGAAKAIQFGVRR